MRVDRARLMVIRPPSKVRSGREGAVVRVEFYVGDDQLESTEGHRSAAPPGVDLPQSTERGSHAGSSIAFEEPVSGMRPGSDKSPLRANHDPATPRPAQSFAAPSLTEQSHDAMLPPTVHDHRVPQRGWEREYGVPAYLIGAADVLYYHRKRAANRDVAAIDAAILRLYGPWIRRDASSSPIPQDLAL
jgi:hypothetical protein